MALHQFLCGFTVVIILLSKGCQSQDCGKAPKNTGIVGGGDASPGSWPWQAELREDGKYICVGSLINDQWVLTAAYCITGARNLTVHLGRHNQSAPNNNEVSRGVAETVRHPLYSFLKNDIALLKLSASVNFTDYIRPVCLASENSTFHTGTNTWITGWPYGTSTNILQQVNTSIVGNNQCRCYYKTTITESIICAVAKPNGCQTVPGGPLVIKINDSWVQVGILSVEISCVIPNFPGIYTRVSQYEEWISNVTSSNRPGFVIYTSPGVDSDLNYTCPTSPPITTTTTTATNTDTTATTTTATNTDTTATTTTATNTITTATNTDTTATTTTATNTIATTTSDDKGGDSVFDGGEKVIHFSHFTSLCALVLSLFVLAGDA
ncbi:chymotrypsinogen A [Lates calcarifer]|uniref:Chymotrypsinogen A n=1 Tax=Lates calcarifer TaxID=8187 RepID=A0AAJ7PQB8_LATCA|nr:chymotrypsinogen A [Lates calcarifer]